MMQAVLLLAHGTPESPEQVPEYLKCVTGGRPLPEEVVDEIQHRYALVGRSPLTEITLAQAKALAREIALPVYVGMRNWHPFIADTVKKWWMRGQRMRSSSALLRRIRVPAWAFTRRQPRLLPETS
jgi:protoporphyrin/coproporphyrin ferrochelatase